MNNLMLVLIALTLSMPPVPHAAPAQLARPKAGPLAHTYSIVARDPLTGDMGVAVQSHALSVGGIVSWGEAGVGVVATQSIVDPGYGGRGLELMRRGKAAPQALKELVARDPHPEGRQVALLDARGRVAAFTGPKAIAAAGHHVGREYSVQANIMVNEQVWTAMAAAYEAAQGDLADRLLAALDGAQAAGGDIRGKMSAALLVVRAKSSGRPWWGGDRLFDVRVEDHADPLVELRRLVRLQRAGNYSNRGDELITEKKVDEALTVYRKAMELAPEVLEFQFWYAATLVVVDKETEATALFKDLFAKEPFWMELVRRLPAAGLFPSDPELMKRIQALAPTP